MIGPVRIVGTGLIGTSLGLALRALGVPVQLSDPQPAAVALAQALGAGQIVGTPEVAEGAEGRSESPTIVVVAAPPDVVGAVVAQELARWPLAVVTDVASVKSAPLRQVRQLSTAHRRYVGGHPLAGRERSGAAAAQADLFMGRPWVLTPADDVDPQAVAMVRELVESVGAIVHLMAPEQHDEAVAVVSHMPQVAASLVAAQLQRLSPAAAALSGQGVRDVTRIAASDPELWTQILAANSESMHRTLVAVRADLDDMIAALATLESQPNQDNERARHTIRDLVTAGNVGRRRIPGKHGSAPTAYGTVSVMVPDQPGELARLLRDIGAAGVNIEDLRLEHSEGRPMGLAQVDVVPDATEILLKALDRRGWSVHN
jgi:prephenate dehydrogenase